jgi:hypothetical protein
MPRDKKAPGRPTSPAAARKKQLQQLRARLEAERRRWVRWLARFKRAFGAFLKAHARMARLERQIAKVQEAAKHPQANGS